MERKRGVPATRLEEEVKADCGSLPLRKGEEDIVGVGGERRWGKEERNEGCYRSVCTMEDDGGGPPAARPPILTQ